MFCLVCATTSNPRTRWRYNITNIPSINILPVLEPGAFSFFLFFFLDHCSLRLFITSPALSLLPTNFTPYEQCFQSLRNAHNHNNLRRS